VSRSSALLAVALGLSCAPAAVVPPPIPVDPASFQAGVVASESLAKLGYLGYVGDAVSSLTAMTQLTGYLARTTRRGGTIGLWGTGSIITYRDNGHWTEQRTPAFGLLLRSPPFPVKKWKALELGVGWYGGWVGLPGRWEVNDRWMLFASPNVGIGARHLAQLPVGVARATPWGTVHAQLLTGVLWGMGPTYASEVPWQVGLAVGYSASGSGEP